MDRVKLLFQYYLKGFALTQKSIDIYLITLVLTLPEILYSVFPTLSISAILFLLSQVFTMLGLGFSLSIPIFLIQKQQNKPWDYKDMLSVTFQNTKRIILPSIKLFILLIGFLFIIVVLISIFLHPSKIQVEQFFHSLASTNNGWNIVYFIPAIILSFFTFTPFFFTLEQKGLMESMKESIITSSAHLPFVFTIIIIGIISNSVTKFLPSTEFFGLFLRFAISLYISFLITTSALFYYQITIKGKKE